ncbi:MAG: RES family NAD+ phosphorylase [Verrucomicrobia bacterium]|nr:RES family NAD+ phosphorylase [Verrucomicrobiota bacterium]MCH8513652.1 RES family NAD+ phosphorylase [Kiritimatiellia bacterium]
MRRAWRIVKEKHAASAFDGEGAWRYGGRWNSQGTRVVYASGTKSLAALENLVHLNPPVPFRYVVISIEFDDTLVEKFKLSDLPAEWTEEPPPPSTQVIGDQWVKEARSAVLELPSVIIRDEPNYLLNPAHSDFKNIILGTPEPFSFDPRLL